MQLRGRNENLEARLRQALEDVAERDRDLIRTRAALADSNSNASTLSQQLTALTEEHGRVCAELTDTAGSLKECAQERDGLASQLKVVITCRILPAKHRRVSESPDS